MSLEWAFRLTEILLGLAVVLQSLEHLGTKAERKPIFVFRLLASLILISGIATVGAAPALFLSGLWLLRSFQGPYNGGSDRMTLLALLCLSIAALAPERQWQELAFGYLGIQVMLSYFLAGIVKLRNPEWWSGLALEKIFRDSRYPTSERVRALGQYPKLMKVMGIFTLAFECLFPIFILTPQTLWAGLLIALVFHLINAWLLGLNRFVWAWLAAYPALIWIQGRL